MGKLTSIKSRFVLLSVFFVVFMFGGQFIAESIHLNNNSSETMQSELDNNLLVGANSLEDLLWDFNVDAMIKVTDSILANKHLVAATIYDENGNILIERNVKDYEKQDDAQKTGTMDIVHNGIKLGEFSLIISDRLFKMEERLELLQHSIFALVQTLVLSLLIVRVSSWITKPVSRLEVAIDSFSFKGQSVPIREGKTTEFAGLISSFNKMQDRIGDYVEAIEEGNRETIILLANAIEANDRYTKNHCLRVEKYALMIARELGFNADELKNLSYAAILHDIGKIGIPSEILNKEGKLTYQEYALVKEHTTLGYNILKDSEFLSHSADILLSHHERIDGMGYPLGLKGEEIHMKSRIIAIADAFDAMTSARPYRMAPLTAEQAIDQLRSGSGTQFDCNLVEIFVRRLTDERNI